MKPFGRLGKESELRKRVDRGVERTVGWVLGNRNTVIFR